MRRKVCSGAQGQSLLPGAHEDHRLVRSSPQAVRSGPPALERIADRLLIASAAAAPPTRDTRRSPEPDTTRAGGTVHGCQRLPATPTDCRTGLLGADGTRTRGPCIERFRSACLRPFEAVCRLPRRLRRVGKSGRVRSPGGTGPSKPAAGRRGAPIPPSGTVRPRSLRHRMITSRDSCPEAPGASTPGTVRCGWVAGRLGVRPRVLGVTRLERTHRIPSQMPPVERGRSGWFPAAPAYSAR
jgi:hypothetical protein